MALFGKNTTEDNKDDKTQKDEVKLKSAPKKEEMKDLYKDQKSEKGDKKEEKTGLKGTNAYKVLVKPLITEKVANLGAENKYAFEVNPNFNKIEIAKAVNEVYGILPTKVNVTNVMGKKVRHGKYSGKRKDWKKAIVTLPKGKTINIYEGV